MIRILLLCLPLAAAADTGGVVFPERWTLGQTGLIRNGEGLREYGFMGIDIYAAALYLKTAAHDAAAVLSSSEPKVLHMHFLRDFTRQDTLKAWDHSFAQNCPPPCALPQKELAAFQAFIPDSRRGDTQTYEFYADRVNVRANSRPIGSVEGAAFSRLLLSTWIGAAPPTEALKRALLGLDRE